VPSIRVPPPFDVVVLIIRLPLPTGFAGCVYLADDAAVFDGGKCSPYFSDPVTSAYSA